MPEEFDKAEMDAALESAIQHREQPTYSAPSTADDGPKGEGQGTPDKKPDQSQSVNAHTDAGDDKGKPSDTPPTPADDKPDAEKERKERNRYFAQRRIAAKEERKRRYEEDMKRLQQERDAYADEKGEYHNPQMAAVKEDQIRELEIARVREAQQEWESEAYDLFSPEDAKTFVEDSRNLADWINNREPELTTYLNRPYGKHLLKGWFDKVAKNEQASNKWNTLNSFEKSRILDKFYNELESFGRRYANGEIDATGKPIQKNPAPNTNPNSTPNPAPAQTQPQQTQPTNVPVPGSGRDTNTMPSTDNFGLALQTALNRRRR